MVALGKHHSEENKIKISEATKLAMTPERCLKISELQIGRKQKPETIKKRISKTKGRKRSPEFIEKCKLDALNRWQNPEYRQHQKENHVGSLGHKHTPEQKEKMSKAHIGFKHTDESVDKIRQSSIGRGLGEKHTEEHKEKIRIAMIEEWKDPEIHDKRVKATMDAIHLKPTMPEIKLKELLDKHFPGRYNYTGDGARIVAGLCPDFTDMQNKRVVEMFGDYWHQGENPQDKIDRYAKSGFKCLVIWQSELKNISLVVNRLYSFNK